MFFFSGYFQTDVCVCLCLCVWVGVGVGVGVCVGVGVGVGVKDPIHRDSSLAQSVGRENT